MLSRHMKCALLQVHRIGQEEELQPLRERTKGTLVAV